MGGSGEGRLGVFWGREGKKLGQGKRQDPVATVDANAAFFFDLPASPCTKGAGICPTKLIVACVEKVSRKYLTYLLQAV